MGAIFRRFFAQAVSDQNMLVLRYEARSALCAQSSVRHGSQAARWRAVNINLGELAKAQHGRNEAMVGTWSETKLDIRSDKNG